MYLQGRLTYNYIASCTLSTILKDKNYLPASSAVEGSKKKRRFIESWLFQWFFVDITVIQSFL